DDGAGGGESFIGGLHQPRLHLVRRNLGLGLYQERSRSAYHRRGHAGAAQKIIVTRRGYVGGAKSRLVITEKDQILGIRRGEGFIDILSSSRVPDRWCTQGNNPIPRRNNVRLDDVVQQRGSLGAVAGDQGVGSQRAAFGLHGAHGDDVRVVARGSDGRVAAGAHGVVPAVVAGRGDAEDAVR